MRAIVVRELGGPDVLVVEDVDDPQPGPGEVLVEVDAVGVNFIDTYHRTGLYARELPFTPGSEAAGTVLQVGDGVESLRPGDRVAYASAPGAYAERAVASAEALVSLPDELAFDTAAAVMLQGLTAHYLAHDTYRLDETSTCLIHAGAGGVGLLLTQMAKGLGATVLATVGNAEKAELSRGAGADHVILYNEVDFVHEIERLAGPRPIDVVYDGVGKATVERGFSVLRPLGLMAAFGNASGAVEPVDPLTLTKNGSLYFTRPTLATHIATPGDLKNRARDLFKLLEEIDVHIGARFEIAEAADAHRALEGRQTTGKVLLIP